MRGRTVSRAAGCDHHIVPFRTASLDGILLGAGGPPNDASLASMRCSASRPGDLWRSAAILAFAPLVIVGSDSHGLCFPVKRPAGALRAAVAVSQLVQHTARPESITLLRGQK